MYLNRNYLPIYEGNNFLLLFRQFPWNENFITRDLAQKGKGIYFAASAIHQSTMGGGG